MRKTAGGLPKAGGRQTRRFTGRQIQSAMTAQKEAACAIPAVIDVEMQNGARMRMVTHVSQPADYIAGARVVFSAGGDE